MRKTTLLLAIILFGIYGLNAQTKTHKGFFDFTYHENTDQIILEVDKLDVEFLYVNYLSAGMGSNDIGLDRGQVGNTRLVKFIKRGNKLLLLQPNYDYRAKSSNPYEIQTVEDAFAKSVIWGFEIKEKKNGHYFIDVTDFMIRDAHKISWRLNKQKQGNYKLDKTRSAFYMEQCKNFPQNSEFEVLTTYTGIPLKRDIGQVTPSPSNITVRQHYSFVQLPDDNFEMREFHSRSAYFSLNYKDYSSPLHEDIDKKFIYRHRLKKKNPDAVMSEAVEPIIYYVDRGAPEPIRTALLEGASWWNQAFEAIGYKDAFQVKLLPKGADPLDIRYNVIQWVHRSSRGWSYGGSISDPRTGEIIKGKVTLGSLRVRQDYLIAEGLLSPYKNGDEIPKEVEEMALARIRQLSAHEVGHTLGLAHNYIASTEGRTSVMDYPHPLVEIIDGKISLDNAYTQEIGAWDIVSVNYGYQDFAKGINTQEALNNIVQKSIADGFSFLSDQDAQLGGAHPYTHQWDNGLKAYEELDRVMEIRALALKNLGKNSIKTGEPFASIEGILVPIYFFHRYQINATAKTIGGLNYTYAMRGDGQMITEFILAEEQMKALDALMNTLKPEVLKLPETLLQIIPPPPMGTQRSKEFVKTRTAPTFDALAAAEAAAGLTFKSILHPARAGRLVEYHARNTNQPSLESVIDRLINETWEIAHLKGYEAAIQKTVDQVLLQELMQLAANKKASALVKSIVSYKIEELHNWLEQQLKMNIDTELKAHYNYALQQIHIFEKNPEKYIIEEPLAPPPGSPIGMGR